MAPRSCRGDRRRPQPVHLGLLKFCDMTPVHLDRRRFLGLGAAGVATLATVRLTPAGAQTLPGPQPAAAAASAPFTLGVASGDQQLPFMSRAEDSDHRIQESIEVECVYVLQWGVVDVERQMLLQQRLNVVGPRIVDVYDEGMDRRDYDRAALFG